MHSYVASCKSLSALERSNVATFCKGMFPAVPLAVVATSPAVVAYLAERLTMIKEWPILHRYDSCSLVFFPSPPLVFFFIDLGICRGHRGDDVFHRGRGQ